MGAPGRPPVLTRCPACETHFRVTAEQLKVRSGRVRCGACQHVFNALDSLVEEPTVVLVAQSAPEPSQDSIPPSLHKAEAEPVATPEFEAEPLVVSGAAEPAPDAVPPAPTAEPLAEEAQEAAEPEPVAFSAAAVPAEPAESAPADAGTEADAGIADSSETLPEPATPPRRWPWLVASLFALAALSLQAVLAFRVELAILAPQFRPALVALCEIATCEVGLPAKVGMIGIEASDLHPDSEHKGRLALAATLRNRAPFAQQFPHLELTLTDTSDQAVARKVLAPKDYLPVATSLAGGMPSNADIAVTVGVDSGEIAASGYRLYLFYP
jgi:predicted Zn finger-like uncharacterized protein